MNSNRNFDEKKMKRFNQALIPQHYSLTLFISA